jgi:hypothetical protein
LWYFKGFQEQGVQQVRCAETLQLWCCGEFDLAKFSRFEFEQPGCIVQISSEKQLVRFAAGTVDPPRGNGVKSRRWLQMQLVWPTQSPQWS